MVQDRYWLLQSFPNVIWPWFHTVGAKNRYMVVWMWKEGVVVVASYIGPVPPGFSGPQMGPVEKT